MENVFLYLDKPIKCCNKNCNGSLNIEELIYTKSGWRKNIEIECCNNCNTIYIFKSTYEANKNILKKFGIGKAKEISILEKKKEDIKNCTGRENKDLNNNYIPIQHQNTLYDKVNAVETIKNLIIKDLFININTEKCVIDIFLQDKRKFSKRIENINKESLKFLDKCKVQLKKEAEKGKILFFRKYNYEKILNEYLSERYHADISNISLISNDQEKKSEKEILVQNEEDDYVKNGKSIGTENQYVQEEIKEVVTSISKDEIRKMEEQKERIIQEKEVISNVGKISWNKKMRGDCFIYEGVFRDGKLVEFISNNTMKVYIFKYDKKPICYVGYDGNKIVELIESTHPKIKKNKNIIVVVNKKQISSGKELNKTISTEIEQKQKKESAEKNAELEAQRKLREERRILHQERMKAEQEAKRLKELEKQRRRQQIEKEEQESLEKLPQIGVKDFVVRRAVFKCMHSKHKVVDLAAAIRVIGDDGKAKLIKISAGYCKVCKIYFIMESTYEKIRKRGIVLCRICDEKSYMKNSFVNGMRLAQESILMQFGYTVSQTEGLSSTSRQKILAVMIDNDVLTKSEIISYLDFFISQRQHQSKFGIAVSKWEADREFVEEYRIGEYTQFGVNAIYRR